jgi:hypothetical protein
MKIKFTIFENPNVNVPDWTVFDENASESKSFYRSHVFQKRQPKAEWLCQHESIYLPSIWPYQQRKLLNPKKTIVLMKKRIEQPLTNSQRENEQPRFSPKKPGTAKLNMFKKLERISQSRAQIHYCQHLWNGCPKPDFEPIQCGRRTRWEKPLSLRD